MISEAQHESKSEVLCFRFEICCISVGKGGGGGSYKSLGVNFLDFKVGSQWLKSVPYIKTAGYIRYLRSIDFVFYDFTFKYEGTVISLFSHIT